MTFDLTSLRRICTLKSVTLWQKKHSRRTQPEYGVELKKIFDFSQKQNLKIIAVLGLFDKGKSFMINKLFGKTVPHGKLHTTRGLNFLYVEDKEYLVIDSQGVQATVAYKAGSKDTDDVDPTVDAQMTEAVVFRLISEIAHHVIFVCNDLTWNEQKYLTMLASSEGSKTNVIALHNLQNTVNSEEAENIFKQQIHQCYSGGQVKATAGLIYTSKNPSDSGREMLHIGVCKEGTEAGDKYNAIGLEHIHTRIQFDANMIGQEISLPELLQDKLQKLLPVHLRLKNEGVQGGAAPTRLGDQEFKMVKLDQKVEDDEDAEEHDREDAEQVSHAANLFQARNDEVCAALKLAGEEDHDKKSNNQRTAKPKTEMWMESEADEDVQKLLTKATPVVRYEIAQPGQSLLLEAQGTFDSLGMAIYHRRNFDPIVNEYEDVDEDGQKWRHLSIEAPGVKRQDIQVSAEDGGIFQIVMEKKKMISDKAKVYRGHGKIRQGFHSIVETDGTFNTKFSLDGFELPDPIDGTIEDGIFKMKMKLRQVQIMPKSKLQKLQELQKQMQQLEEEIKTEETHQL